MELNVPYFRQEHSKTCGLAVLRMVFGFYGESSTEKDLLKEVNMHSFGSFSTDLGITAIKRGFKATAFTYHLSLLSPLKIPFNSVVDEVTLSKITPKPKDRMICESWKKYVRVGGKLIWSVPAIRQLSECVDDRKAPAIISVNTAALNRFWKKVGNGHYLVVSGIAEEVSVLDPDPVGHGRQYTVPKDALLAAWIVNSTSSSDYLMVLEK